MSIHGNLYIFALFPIRAGATIWFVRKYDMSIHGNIYISWLILAETATHCQFSELTPITKGIY